MIGEWELCKADSGWLRGVALRSFVLGVFASGSYGCGCAWMLYRWEAYDAVVGVLGIQMGAISVSEWTPGVSPASV
jgi:hypothetical protein